MKKLFTVVLVTVLTASIFAVSYKNNTYQKLADEYTKKAQTALDAGEYELSYEYAQKATENAELSKAYIQMMLARTDAENYISMAKNQLAYAEKIDAEHTFPMAYTSAKENLDISLRKFSIFCSLLCIFIR